MARITKYESLLPMYLRGSNIERHSAIMDEEDVHITQELHDLEHVFSLRRPILVENCTTSSTSSTVRIYFHSDEKIRRITVSGDYSFDEEFSEDSVLTDKILEFTFTVTNPPVMPHLNISFETWDEKVYSKSYPENDEKQGDMGDHDFALDIIGELMGLPRRSHKSYNFDDEGAYAVPMYFAKNLVFDSGSYFAEETTEDDYYYAQRILQFVSHLLENLTPLNLLRSKWGYNNVTISNIVDMDPAVVKQYFTFFSDMTLEEVTSYISGCEHAIYIIFYDNAELPSNVYPLGDDYQEQEYLNQYFTCTRLVTMHEMGESSVSQTVLDVVAGEENIMYTVYLSNAAVLPNTRFDVTVDGVTSEMSSDSHGRFYLSLGGGSHTVRVADHDSEGDLVDESFSLFIPSFTSSSRQQYFIQSDEHIIIESVLNSESDGGAFATSSITYTLEEE